MEIELLIGITGKKQHGKDTSCDYLVSQYGYTKSRFAAKLKHVTQMIFNFKDTSEEAKETLVNVSIYDRNILLAFKELGIPVHLWDTMLSFFYSVFGKHITAFNDSGAELNVSNRVAQQLIGSEFGRTYQNDLWVSLLDMSAPKTVVADCRFDNEAEFIKNNKGVVIKVVNPRVVSDDTHISEKGVDEQYVDYTILNDGTVYDLHRKIDRIMEEIDC